MSQFTYPGRRHATFDAELELAAPSTTTVKTPVVGQVGGSDQILDIGAGQVQAWCMLDLTDVQIPVGDELYRFVLLGSTDDPTMATNLVALDIFEAGANGTLAGDLDVGAARYIRPFNNFFGNVACPYVQIQLTASALGAVSISWSAWITHDPI